MGSLVCWTTGPTWQCSHRPQWDALAPASSRWAGCEGWWGGLRQQGQLIRPLQWYYKHATIIPSWTYEHLVYKTQLPVVLPVGWHHVEIQQWPLPLQAFQGHVLLPDAVLRNTETGDLDVPPQFWCKAAGSSAWPDQPCWHTVHPCVTQLLAEASTYDPSVWSWLKNTCHWIASFP